MQHQNITIRLIDCAGQALGSMILPATCRLIDLDVLRSLGVTKLEVLRR